MVALVLVVVIIAQLCVAAMIIGLVWASSGLFPGVPPRAWSGVLVIAAVASVAVSAWMWTQSTHRWFAVGSALAAPMCTIAAIYMWRRARGQRVVRTAGARGELGLLLVAAVMAGVLGRSTLSYVGAGLALALWIVLSSIDGARAGSAIARVKQRLADVRDWPQLPGAAGLARSGFAGLANGHRVSVVQDLDQTRVVMALPRWPDALELVRRDGAQGGEIGDDAFDHAVRLVGADAQWRPVLTADLRAGLAAMFARWTVRLADAELTATLDEAETDELEQLLDAAVAIAAAVERDGAGPPGAPAPALRVLELARVERVAAVRWGHYRWLSEQPQHAPRAYRAAAADADPAIAAWGQAQLAPDAGPFR